MINISLKHTLPAYQSSHYTGKVNCVRGGLGPLNHEEVAQPLDMFTYTTQPTCGVFRESSTVSEEPKRQPAAGNSGIGLLNDLSHAVTKNVHCKLKFNL